MKASRRTERRGTKGGREDFGSPNRFEGADLGAASTIDGYSGVNGHHDEEHIGVQRDEARSTERYVATKRHPRFPDEGGAVEGDEGVLELRAIHQGRRTRSAGDRRKKASAKSRQGGIDAEPPTSQPTRFRRLWPALLRNRQEGSPSIWSAVTICTGKTTEGPRRDVGERRGRNGWQRFGLTRGSDSDGATPRLRVRDRKAVSRHCGANMMALVILASDRHPLGIGQASAGHRTGMCWACVRHVAAHLKTVLWYHS
ncbi:hypothetical protein DFH07DRAFT_765645 [Mycena maculata]|uniref:Uncharacterized protein n=1 Tax=Mycena maculata TaxID=230809 RepID=A0AAD7K8M4_9AGAR|nr:hypothetical protein DFH07DRAFT_765645 [Mycena maculata]